MVEGGASVISDTIQWGRRMAWWWCARNAAGTRSTRSSIDLRLDFGPRESPPIDAAVFVLKGVIVGTEAVTVVLALVEVLVVPIRADGGKEEEGSSFDLSIEYPILLENPMLESLLEPISC